MKHKLIIVSLALTIASCSAGETAPTTSTEVAKKKVSKEDPFSVADIPDAQTTFAN